MTCLLFVVLPRLRSYQRHIICHPHTFSDIYKSDTTSGKYCPLSPIHLLRIPLTVFSPFNHSLKWSISLIYNLISGLKQTPLTKIKLAWEKDLKTVFFGDTWDRILKQVHSSSLCAHHSLLQFKVVHRAHISKMKLSKMYPELSPNCDKCGSPEATLIHMFWFCPSHEQFWRGIFETLSDILKHTFEPDPLIVLFGVTGIEGLPKAKCNALAFASLLARRTILLNWKGNALPTHSQWLKDLISCLSLEKICQSLHKF